MKITLERPHGPQAGNAETSRTMTESLIENRGRQNPAMRIAMCALVAVISGCAAFPGNRGELPASRDVTAQWETSWLDEMPAISYVPIADELVVRQTNPLPARLRDKTLSLELTRETTLQDLASILTAQGIPTLVARDSGGSGAGGAAGANDAEVIKQIPKAPPSAPRDPQGFGNRKVDLIQSKGTFGELADAVRELNDVEIEYRGGHVIISPDATYILNVPQGVDISEQMAETLGKLGATDVRHDLTASMLAYRAKPAASRLIDRYVERATRNAATINLQVAVINVAMNSDRQTGFDWSGLAMRIGRLATQAATGPINPAFGEQDDEQSFFDPRRPQTGQEVDEEEFVRNLGEGLIISNRRIDGAIERSDFGIGAVFKALSEYGEVHTEQDISMSTLAGSPVVIESGRDVPFVGNRGAAFQGGNSFGSGVFGNAQVETVQTGLKLTITPRYDSNSSLVTNEIDLEVDDLVAIREFDGGQLGPLSHPEVQLLRFTNIARLKPGEAVLLGGISSSQTETDYTSVAGLEDKPVGSKDARTDRTALFILIRPTIKLFTEPSLMALQPEPAEACRADAVTPASDERVSGIDSVYFASGSAVMSMQQRDYLYTLARQLDDGQRLVIKGYADRSGPQASSAQIARQRENEVQRFLRSIKTNVSRSGSAYVYCSAALQAEENAQHRRVEIWKLEKREDG